MSGTVPHDVCVEAFGLPTIGLPHSDPGCNQHGPDGHNLALVLLEGREVMTGRFWDFGARR